MKLRQCGNNHTRPWHSWSWESLSASCWSCRSYSASGNRAAHIHFAQSHKRLQYPWQQYYDTDRIQSNWEPCPSSPGLDWEYFDAPLRSRCPVVRNRFVQSRMSPVCLSRRIQNDNMNSWQFKQFSLRDSQFLLGSWGKWNVHDQVVLFGWIQMSMLGRFHPHRLRARIH